MALIAGGIFVLVYGLIVTERIHRTLAALLGASLVLLSGLLDQSEAFSRDVVDFNVIFLLAGMMIIANILAKTGVFQWIGVEAVLLGRGRPYRLLVMSSALTAVASAFLDNVTTVVLLTPITFFIAKRLRISPVPFLVSQVIASNIGGTATLIGDPPNIIIGSRFGRDFSDFLVSLTVPIVFAFVAYVIFARWLFRRDLAAAGAAITPEEIAQLAKDERKIADPRLMRISLGVLGLTIVGFLLSRPLHLEGATIALTGAVVLMIVAGEDVREILRSVEWPTLFFFFGLFIVVGAVVKAGLIASLAAAALQLTGGDLGATAFLVLWMSGIVSAVVDNIPYTITMIPLVQQMGGHMSVDPLIWALALGANLGGNATVVGASANVVVASMSEAQGYPITFRDYLRYGVPATLVTMAVATLAVWFHVLMA